jgi:hypothetical protein
MCLRFPLKLISTSCQPTSCSQISLSLLLLCFPYLIDLCAPYFYCCCCFFDCKYC